MKLKPKEHLQPEQLRLTLPGEVARDLKLFIQYQTEHGVTWEPKDLLAEILRAYLQEGNRDFLTWKKTRHNHRPQLNWNAAAETGGEAAQEGKGEVKARVKELEGKSL